MSQPPVFSLVLHIPVVRTVQVPMDDGSPGYAVFTSETGFFLISEETYQYLGDFVETPAPEPAPTPIVVPEPPPPPRALTPKEVRERMLKEQILTAAVTPPAPTRPGPIDPPGSGRLAGLGIKTEAPKKEESSLFRTGEFPQRDGLDFTDSQLSDLVDLIYDEGQPGYIRGQAFQKLVDCPTTVLYRSRRFMDADVSAEGLAHRVAQARASRLSLGESYMSLPNDLAAFVLGSERGMQTSTMSEKLSEGLTKTDLSAFDVPEPPARILEAGLNATAAFPRRQAETPTEPPPRRKTTGW